MITLVIPAILLANCSCSAQQPKTEYISGPLQDSMTGLGYHGPMNRPKTKQQQRCCMPVNALPGEQIIPPYLSTPGEGDLESAKTLNEQQIDRILWESNYIKGLLDQRETQKDNKRKDKN